MLATLLLLVLAINGGLFAGTLMYSAYKASRMEELTGYAERLWRIMLLFQ
jgi:hypothetical protein